MKNAPILPLDAIAVVLDAAARGRTTFIIAHRLSTVRRVDRNLVFRDGLIVEVDGFDELPRQGGRFAVLALAQGGHRGGGGVGARPQDRRIFIAPAA